MVAGRSPAGGQGLVGSSTDVPLGCRACRHYPSLGHLHYGFVAATFRLSPSLELVPLPAPWGRRTRHRRPAPRYRPGCSAGESRRGTWRSGRRVSAASRMVHTFRALAAVCSSLLISPIGRKPSCATWPRSCSDTSQGVGADRTSIEPPSLRPSLSWQPPVSVAARIASRIVVVGRPLRQQEDHLVGAAGPVPDGFRHRVRLVPHDGRPQYPAVVLEREGHAPGETEEHIFDRVSVTVISQHGPSRSTSPDSPA